MRRKTKASYGRFFIDPVQKFTFILSGIIGLLIVMGITMYIDSVITPQDRKSFLIPAFALTVIAVWHSYLKKIKISIQQGMVSIKLP